MTEMPMNVKLVEYFEAATENLRVVLEARAEDAELMDATAYVAHAFDMFLEGLSSIAPGLGDYILNGMVLDDEKAAEYDEAAEALDEAG